MPLTSESETKNTSLNDSNTSNVSVNKNKAQVPLKSAGKSNKKKDKKTVVLPKKSQTKKLVAKSLTDVSADKTSASDKSDSFT